MKKRILFPSLPFTAASSVALVLALATSSYAGLSLPYTPDGSTLHLWHFDGPTNTLTTTDEVVTAGITLTNFAQSQVPGSQITLGNPAAIAPLGTSLQIIPTNFNAGNTYALAVNAASQTNTAFRNSDSGAFTMEAIIKCTGNPYVGGNGNWEIIAGDNSGSAGLTGTRGWQFRIQSGAQPQLNFNFISGGGSNLLAKLPTTGPNVLLQGIWYHVAVTYTGNNPTNGDPAGIVTFYWTVLDGGRTNATALSNYVTSGTFTVGGNPVLAVGGSARNLPGTVANGEGFKGYIDEVRISDVCRRSNEMAFIIGGAATAPAFLQQPPTNTFIGYGQALSLPALVTSAPTYYWFHDGTNLASQTDSSLLIPNATFADAGSYQLIASNVVGSVTSVVAQVTIGAQFSELFVTGVSNNGALAEAITTDAHYALIESSDAANLGPNTTVWDMNAYPIAAFGGNLANADGVSQWIGPQGNPAGAGYASPVGQYTYRTHFLLDSVDLSQPVKLSGIWWVNEFGNDIRINGNSTGLSNSAANSSAGKNPANFVITNGFVPGLNTLDFVTTRSPQANGSYQESALRVEMSGLGSALPAGVPAINTQPANQTVRDASAGAGSVATFSVVAVGRPPLSYQWWADGAPVSGATNRTLTFVSPTAGAQGTSFTVVVSNDSGSVTSAPAAVLTLLATNQPPITPGYSGFVVYLNSTLTFNISTLFHGASDLDGDPLTFVGADAGSTNGGAIVQNGIDLVYSPGNVGPDQFNYFISDGLTVSAGPIDLTVLPVVTPTISVVSKVGTNLVFSGTGGVAGGAYHVLTSTNIVLPLTNWTSLGSNTFGGSGEFSVTNPIAPNTPQRYYILQIP